jgi:nitroreductase
MNILPEITNRTSIRKFREAAVPKDVIMRILEAGRLAPSAKNRQPWRFIVIDDPDKKAVISEAAYSQDYVKEAAAVIAVCTTNIDYKMPNGQLSWPMDLSFAASFMMLQAVREGLGTCILTTYDEQDVSECLTLPWSMKVPLLLLVGYPDEAGKQPERKNIEQMVSYNHW